MTTPTQLTLATDGRLDQSGAFAKGDRVKVKGLPGDFTIAYFRIERDGTVATVYGGAGGRQQYRSVAVDRLIKHRKGKGVVADARS